MRIGLVGTGRIGSLHATTLAGLDAVTSLVLADAESARAASLAARLGVECLADPSALFEAGLDGLVIAAATDAHAPLVLAAVDAGLPTFCEKPVASDIAGTLVVLNRVSDSDVPVHIGFQRRFDPGFVAAREAVRSGELGWIHTLRAGTLDPAPPPAAYIASSGGFFRDCSVHDFDILRWVTGREVVEVYAVGANRGAAFFSAYDDVDAASALLTFDDSSFAHVAGTRYNARGYDVRLELLGSTDSICVGLDDRLPLRSVEAGVRFPGASPYPVFADRFHAAYVAELAAFVEVAGGGRPSPCTVADALEAFYIAEACELSRRRHRPVLIDEVRR